MAATCEERGIKHVKDVFKSPPNKSNSITFMARTKTSAPAPPSKTSAGTATTLNRGTKNENPDSKPKTNGVAANSPVSNGIHMNGDAKKNEKLTRGDYFLRAEKDKKINTMELPVPVSKPKTTQNPLLNKTSVSSQEEDIYLSPSPVSSPTSPGYSKSFPAPASPGYSTNITNKPSTTARQDSQTKYPAPAPPVPQPPTYKSLFKPDNPKSSSLSKSKPEFKSKAVVELQPMTGFQRSPPLSPDYSSSPPESGTVYAHHVEVHRPAGFTDNPSPVYDRKLDFLNHPAPVSPDRETGSLFNGYDDPPYSTGPISPSSDITNVLDKANNNSKILFKNKGNKEDHQGRYSNKHGGDETSSSIAPSSGYHSEFDSELSSSNSPVSKKGTTTKSALAEDDSFEEEECTLDFADDDGMYAAGPKYSLYREYEGEDFSKYMQDDNDYLPQYSTTSLARKVQQRRRMQQQAPRPAPKQYASNTRPQQAPGLKQRLSKALTATKSDKNKYVYQAQPLTKIHQFSFMDSKMGNYTDERELQDYVSRDLETRSDLGGVAKRDSVALPAWHNDTLSVSTLRRAKKMLDQQAVLSGSVPNLNRSQDLAGAQGSTHSLNHKSYSDFAADIKHKKKVNRFKFWKIFGKKKSKKGVNDGASSIGFDEPKLHTDDANIMDVHL